MRSEGEGCRVDGVALLAEGVDRNFRHFADYRWALVALLAEGVDRNVAAEHFFGILPMSPSSRRAWIEMEMWLEAEAAVSVALLAEGVDRNNPAAMLTSASVQRRPPRGGRG